MEVDHEVGVSGSEPDLSIDAWKAEFADPAIEDEFRRTKVHSEARRLSDTLLVGGSIFPLFSIPDFMSAGPTASTFLMLLAELVVAVAAVTHAVRLRRRPELVLRHGTLIAIESLAMASLMPVIAFRPEQLQALNLTYCVLVLALFAFVPNRFVCVVPVCGAGFVAVAVLSWFGDGGTNRNDLRSVMALGTLTMVAGWIGNTLQRTRREEFASVLLERWSNERLLDEIARRRELEAELVWLADHDELTDVWNRRAFHDRAEAAVAVAQCANRPTAVLVIDADHFKLINDGHGHHMGDEAIRTLARLCTQNLRSGDLLGRIGGEEFAVLMPDTDLRRAQEVASRLRECVARASIEHSDGRVSMTVSIGAVECRADERIDEALRRADAAMYEAKAAGRNRVVAAAAC